MKKIILYGIGKRGIGIYNYLKHLNLDKYIYGFCDENVNSTKVGGKDVYSLDELAGETDILFCITLMDKAKRAEIQCKLKDREYIDFSDLATIFKMNRVEFNRGFCAHYHEEGMDNYFELAEQSLDIFWSPNSEFYKMFKKLDTTNIIELACGRGRHVPNYIDQAGEVTLVDILQKNIDICKNRFSHIDKINYYKNNGYNLRDLESNKYTSLYSYDAMVHFELIDIYSYLQEIYRVLKNDGLALIHHSNYHSDYKANFNNAPHSRSFMSKECFAYLAYQTGFQIISQKVIDWASEKELDCLSLIQK